VRRPTLATKTLYSITRVGGPGLGVAHRLERLRAAGLRPGIGGLRGTWAQAPALKRNDSGTYLRIWTEAATALGADVEKLGAGFLVLRRAGAETLVQRNLTMFDHPASVGLALDKSIMHGLLVAGGVPVADHVEGHRNDLGAVADTLAASGGRWVVKPASDTGGGYGVTCGVESADDLYRAWLWASVWNDRILLERQVTGIEYRLLFLDGEFVDAVRRDLPTVVGDGHSSVGELIAGENERRVEAGPDEVSRIIKVDLDCELALRRAGLRLRSVVPAGEHVTVKGNAGDNRAADNATARDLSPEIVRVAAHASRLARLRLSGVDLVTPDPTRSLDDAGGAILEVNGTPGLQHHYLVRDPTRATRVAEVVLERLLEEGSPST
jgi:cyanophycin synthetase